MEFYQALFHLMAHDPGGRGLHGPQPDLPGLAKTLLRCRRALLVTGFPVPRPGTSPAGETDGPVGTAELALALNALGCRVTVVTDAYPLPQVQAALRAAGEPAELVCIPRQPTEPFFTELLRQAMPDVLISLERPGKAADGHYHNMHGAILDDAVADTDALFALAKAKGIVTVGIGDGGNELGLGALRKQAAVSVAHGGLIAAHQAADYTLTAGVSNWWGGGLSALLSRQTGQELLPTPAQETALLQAVVSSGGVDGCTGEAALSVDGLPLPVHLGRLAALDALLQQA